MIIATDMALHFEYVKNFKNLISSEEVDFEKDENKVFIMSMCIHISDLTNPTKLWEESYKWSLLVYEEFFVQGDKEKELGLPIGDLNDRKNINLAQSQIGFIDFIVQPAFEIFWLFLPKVYVHIDQAKSNKSKWSSLVSEWNRIKEEGNDLAKKFIEAEEEGIEESHGYITYDANKQTADAPNNL